MVINVIHCVYFTVTRFDQGEVPGTKQRTKSRSYDTNTRENLRYSFLFILCVSIFLKKCKVSIPTLSFALGTSGDQKWLVVGLLFAFDTSYHSVEH